MLIDRETVINTLKSVVPNFYRLKISDDANLLEQRIIDSGQFVDLITQLEEYSGKEIDFVAVDPETVASIDGFTRLFNNL